MLQRSARDGVEKIERERHSACIGTLFGQLQALTHGFAHAYDASGTDFHPDGAGRGYGAQLVGVGMCGAKSREI